MARRRILFAIGLGMAALASTAVAQAPSAGTAIVRVVTQPLGGSGSFTFTGVPSGTVSAGGHLEVSGLDPGRYTSTQVVAPGYFVTAVVCDDADSFEPSVGNVPGATATFNIEGGETVTCTFTNASSR